MFPSPLLLFPPFFQPVTFLQPQILSCVFLAFSMPPILKLSPSFAPMNSPFQFFFLAAAQLCFLTLRSRLCFLVLSLKTLALLP